MRPATYQLCRQAWEIRAYTFEGSYFCPDCCPDGQNDYGDTPAPVFVSDDVAEIQCDKCGTVVS